MYRRGSTGAGGRSAASAGGSFRPFVVVFGLPGSGKSTVAERLARRLEAAWISSDAVRTQSGLRGDYSKASIAAVYAQMIELAAARLSTGDGVVLDGSFSSRRFRGLAVELARQHSLPVVFIRLVADEETTLQRVGRKRKLTEAGPEAYRLLKQHFDPVEGEHLVLDSSVTPVGTLVKQALDYLCRLSNASEKVTAD